MRTDKRPLENLITPEEVYSVVKKLKNNKAVGSDEIDEELYK